MSYRKFIFWVGLVLASGFICFGQGDFFERRFNPDVDRIDQEEGRRRIMAFRSFRYEGDYALQFELIHMPRNGGKDVYATGMLWGSWNDQGPVMRIELKSTRDQRWIRLLIQSGPFARIWFLDPEGKTQELRQQDWFNPLFEGMTYTYFDLSLSFIFWDNFVYEGPKRVRCRPAQIFMMYPPEGCAQIYGGVHMAMDADYNMLLQAEMFDCQGGLIKSIKLDKFQKVQEEYIIKQMDVINEITHDKTRFEVVAAAMTRALRINPYYFKPESLSEANPMIESQYYTFLR